MKRTVDIAFAAASAVLLAPFALAAAIMVRTTSRGSILHRSRRIGRFGQEFEMYKFRTMQVNTPHVATHQLSEPQKYLTPVGSILRRTSLDEIPQLLNVLRGEMSIVGPRPALFNQLDLIEQRAALGIDSLRPGITGLAQVRGRDDLSISEKVAFDLEYLETRSIVLDVRILLSTAWKTLLQDEISH